MRIKPEDKARTRERIVAAARRLFARRGLAATTTRELAAEAGIAAGTLFNYFPTKEALAAELLAEAAAAARAEFEGGRRAGASLEEELFALEAAHLRALEPVRGWVRELLDVGLGTLFGAGAEADGEARLRETRLETVRALFAAHGLRGPDLPAAHLYWTVVLGAFASWAHDESPHREDTLALLDRSLRLFVGVLRDDETDPR